MHDVVFRLAREDHHVVKLHQAGLESDTIEDEVQAALESGRGVTQSERHSDPSNDTTVCSQRRLGTVFLGYRHLQISPLPSVLRDDNC